MRLTEKELQSIAEAIPEKDFLTMEPWLTRLYKAIQKAEDAKNCDSEPGHKKPSFEQMHLDHMADVAWYIKGLLAAGNDTFEPHHHRAIGEVMTTIKRDYELKEPTHV